MPSCPHCAESFEEEEPYLRHLRDEHESELGRIDRRRVEGLGDPDSPVPVAPLAIAIVVLALLAVAGVLLIGGGDETGEPRLNPAVHEHGTMSVSIEGESLALSHDDAFIENHEVFHFHGGEEAIYGVHIWHIHGEGVTLQWALGTLGIAVSDDGSVLTYDGVTYDDAETDTTVSVTVNGEPVEPGSFELTGVGPMDEAAAGGGDDVEIVVELTEG